MLAIGLDIGGANTKMAAAVLPEKGESVRVHAIQSRYFPMWTEHQQLPSLLAKLISPYKQRSKTVAATLTAELSDCFRTKRDGVLFVLRSLARTSPTALVLTTNGRLIPIEKALQKPLACASANWIAAPLVLSDILPEFIFVDCGSTTTDIIPVRDGEVLVVDRTDTGRLTNNELVYTGTLRTNVATIVNHVEINGITTSVASENFATMADVNLVLGLISEQDYATPASDNGPRDLRGSLVRLARVICSDIDSMSTKKLVSMAKYIRERQLDKISQSIRECATHHHLGKDLVCIVAGVGAEILAREAASRAGIKTVVRFDAALEDHLDLDLGGRAKEVLHHAPATALSILPHSRPELCG